MLPGSTSIAFYSDSTAFGGAEVSLERLIGELGPGLEINVIGTDAQIVGRLAGRRPGTGAHVVPAIAVKRDASAFLATAGLLRRLRPEILQANLNVPSSSQYALAACALVPSVRTVAVEQLPYPLHGALQRRLKQFTSGRLAAHVAVGERSARQVEEFAGLAPGSVRTIHNTAPDRQLRQLAREVEGPVIGSLGRLDDQKGYDVLLRALAELPEAHLVLVGDGERQPELERQALDLGLRERVRFAGWHEEPRDYLTTFDVFALPSRFEGFPLSIIEAMLAGLPVVATTVGSIAEAVADESTGLLVPPDDPGSLARALGRLLAEPGLRTAMGSRGRERALEFNPAAMARAYVRLYEEILA